jgi:hypothetical protein
MLTAFRAKGDVVSFVINLLCEYDHISIDYTDGFYYISWR